MMGLGKPQIRSRCLHLLLYYGNIREFVFKNWDKPKWVTPYYLEKLTLPMFPIRCATVVELRLQQMGDFYEKPQLCWDRLCLMEERQQGNSLDTGSNAGFKYSAGDFKGFRPVVVSRLTGLMRNLANSYFVLVHIKRLPLLPQKREFSTSRDVSFDPISRDKCVQPPPVM